MGNFGKILDKTKFHNEGDKIYALKPHPNSFLRFFIQQKKIIITIVKSGKKLSPNEKE